MVKKARIKRIAIVVAIVLFLMAGLFFRMLDKMTLHVYDYGSANTSFTYFCMPAKGRKIDDLFKAKARFEKENNTHVEICRLFPKDYWKYWMWEKYARSPYYQFPKCSKNILLPPLGG